MAPSLARRGAVLLAATIALLVMLTVCLMCMGLIQVTSYYAENAFIRHPKVLMSAARRSFKTGDILLFVGAAHGFTNSCVTRVIYSHAAVVVRLGGALYAAESATSEPYMPDPAAPGGFRELRRGTNLVPLADRLDHYCGLVFVMTLSRPLPPAAERRVAAAAREDHPYPSVAQAFLALAGLRTRPRHCFQQVAHLLGAAGLHPAEGPLAELDAIDVVRAVAALPGVPLRGGYEYAPPHWLQFDDRAAAYPAGGGALSRPRARVRAHLNAPGAGAYPAGSSASAANVFFQRTDAGARGAPERQQPGQPELEPGAPEKPVPRDPAAEHQPEPGGPPGRGGHLGAAEPAPPAAAAGPGPAEVRRRS